MSYVVDASVCAKLFIEEDDSGRVVEVVEAHTRGRIRLSAPTLVLYELGNVFWKHPQITEEKMHRFLRRFLDLGVDLVDLSSDEELLRKACEISKLRNMSFYDSAYLALAEKTGVKLLTADEEVHGKAEAGTLLLSQY